MNHFDLLMQFLRDRTQLIETIKEGKRLESIILSLMICSCIFLGIYGAIIGSFNGLLQMVASAIKLPALYIITLFICLPTLYFFNVISGSKRTFSQYLALLLAATAAMAVMLFGFAPVTLFFRLSSTDYQFFQLLNILILAASGIVGIHFFYRSVLFIDDQPAEKQIQNRNVLKAWLFLYGFVGSQLGWTLRPFFGAPNSPFQLFRQIESNFYAHVLKLIGQLLGVS